jgi:hypothetical protein
MNDEIRIKQPARVDVVIKVLKAVQYLQEEEGRKVKMTTEEAWIIITISKQPSQNEPQRNF